MYKGDQQRLTLYYWAGTLQVTDVVFDPSTNLWACCNMTDGVRTCSTPSNETFQDANPTDLFKSVSIMVQPSSTLTPSPYSSTSTTASSSSASATAATSVTPAAASASPTESSSQSLSPAAAAGVGVGAGLGGGILLAAVAFFVFRYFWRRRRQRLTELDGNNVTPNISPGGGGRGGAMAGSVAGLSFLGSADMHKPPLVYQGYRGYDEPMKSRMGELDASHTEELDGRTVGRRRQDPVSELPSSSTGYSSYLSPTDPRW